ncbi:MAG: hypothetical protein HGA96_00175 [Desulfobulbaceae bacterium]|nr:hypothetical protein [Desulfobulbaceae bacterium]
MEADGLYEYMSKLWAMLIWGNKHYVVDKLIKEHGLPTVRRELAELVWGTATIDKRWDHFRKTIKGMGPAMISEILSHAHPEKYMLWSRRVFVGLNYLGVSGLPRYDYQFTGKKYVELIGVTDGIVSALRAAGVKDANHLTADYFIWDELQVEENLSNIFRPSKSTEIPLPKIVEKQESSFIHDEIRDKLADIGQWLGFKSNVEIKVADGSKVDTVWEATIGNMGRVIYIFEVQTKGSIDSLILNLLKSLNNPAVQGVVAVSDHAQLEKIKRHAASVPNLKEKLKYWDYQNVLQVHEALAGVYESINGLGLVPAGF